jgi:hypothetical protein
MDHLPTREVHVAIYKGSHLITPPLLLAVSRLEQNMVVHYYKPITTEWLNFVQNQINEDPSSPALL